MISIYILKSLIQGGVGGKGGGGGRGREMTQALYAHMNNKRKNK
jgi:hypothetical protein